MKLIRVLFISMIAMLSFNTVAAAGSALNDILSSGKLLAGTTGDFNPFSI